MLPINFDIRHIVFEHGRYVYLEIRDVSTSIDDMTREEGTGCRREGERQAYLWECTLGKDDKETGLIVHQSPTPGRMLSKRGERGGNARYAGVKRVRGGKERGQGLVRKFRTSDTVIHIPSRKHHPQQ